MVESKRNAQKYLIDDEHLLLRLFSLGNEEMEVGDKTGKERSISLCMRVQHLRLWR